MTRWFECVEIRRNVNVKEQKEQAENKENSPVVETQNKIKSSTAEINPQAVEVAGKESADADVIVEVETDSQDSQKIEQEEKVIIEGINPTERKIQGKKVRVASKSKKYERNVEDVNEDKLELIDEDANENLDLPCRLLTDFAFYDVLNENKLVSVDSIGLSGKDVVASGVVRVLFDNYEEDENEDDFEQRVTTTCIFYYEVQYKSMTDIWIRTEFAFYKLGVPSEQYNAIYKTFSLKFYLSGTLINTMISHPELSLEEFVAGNFASSQSCSIVFTDDDVSKHIQFVLSEIDAFAEDSNHYQLLSHPLYNQLQKKPKKKRQKTQSASTNRNIRNENDLVLEERNPATVTPFIANLTKGLFKRHIIVKESADAADVVEKHEIEFNTIQHPLVPVPDESVNLKGFWYESIKFKNGLILSAGMFVECKNGKIGMIKRLRLSPVPLVQLNFFVQSTNTILQELANEDEYVNLGESGDVSFVNLSKVLQDIEYHTELRRTKSGLFWRYYYDENTATFIDSPKKVKRMEVRDDLLYFKGREINDNDFILISDDKKDSAYNVGQVVSFNHEKKNLEVRLLHRIDRYVERDSSNERELVYVKDVFVKLSSVEGFCNVFRTCDIKLLLSRPDYFILTKKMNEEGSLVDVDDFMFSALPEAKEFQKLRALDIFAGCGGLTCGLDESGAVETKYAIEFASSAALAFESNFPNVTVYNQCANLLLARAIQLHRDGESLTPMNDYLDRPLPDMPAPGDIDLIYCGPPCQGFSGINRFKKADDIKNSLIATSLSYVDFYKPKYFLLENVRGMVSFRLGGEQIGTNRIAGGIKMGIVKFILRALTSMGYQTRFSIQQAGQHGVSQSRRRFFIWGALGGYPLPEFPQPSHVFLKQGSLTITLPNGTSYTPSERRNGQAIHPPVTVQDAIGDLPGFEFVNPCVVYPEDNPRNSALPQLPVPKSGYCGFETAEYASSPRSTFQLSRRNNSKGVFNQYTRCYNDITVERVCRVGLNPLDDHHTLPDKLKPWCLSHPDSAASRHKGWKGLFGRIPSQGHFLTALTDMQPMGKQGTVIHPQQNRVLTVRECARAQSFPDWFVFMSRRGEVKEMYRQVGNAVPCLLAKALGLGLLDCLEEKSDDKEGAGELEEMMI